MKNYKKDFPIFKNNDLTYLDSGATSQKPQVVLDAVSEYYESYNANIHRGIYKIAEKATKAVDDARKKVATFINAASPDEIIFTKGTTESINLVMYTLGMELIKKQDVIVTTVMEHHSNFVPWQQLAEKKQATFQVVDITEDGKLDEEQILEYTKRAKIFAFTYVSNMLGTINWVSKIIKKVREQNPEIIILIDAAQAVPHKKVDVQELDCDFLVFSGHKMLAETGIGVLYGKKNLLNHMSPFLYGGDMINEVSIKKTTFASLPSKFEAGTINIAGIISLAAAIDYLADLDMESVQKHEKELAIKCIGDLEKLGGITVYGPQDSFSRSGVVSFTVEGIHAHDIGQILADKNICVRSGHHCTMPLHTRLGIAASTRASFYIYNDEKDIEAFIDGIKEAKRLFRA